jgi:triacylglycerol esterase/lipase EstA (alpha/beta hydrolase family)
MRLLLVEDDPRIARFVAKGLREQAYAVDVVGYSAGGVVTRLWATELGGAAKARPWISARRWTWSRVAG